MMYAGMLLESVYLIASTACVGPGRKNFVRDLHRHISDFGASWVVGGVLRFHTEVPDLLQGWDLGFEAQWWLSVEFIASKCPGLKDMEEKAAAKLLRQNHKASGSSHVQESGYFSFFDTKRVLTLECL